MPNSVITSAGLNFVTSAHDKGTLIAIKYFLPVLDYRADPNVHNQIITSAIAVSAMMTSGDTTPTGEIIWNTPSSAQYALTSSKNYIVSAGDETVNGTGPYIITGIHQSQLQYLNSYNSTLLSDHISASDIDFSANSNAMTCTDYTPIAGDNSVPSTVSAGTNRYFSVTDYYPVTSGNTIRGSWKCRLTGNLGTFQFNKIALYAVQVDINGDEIGSPILFAQTGLSSPIIKTNLGANGYDDIIVDTQIQLQSVAATWDEVFFASSADYWSQTPGGLYYSEKVGIGTFQDSIEEPKGKLEIKSKTLQQLVISYDDNKYTVLKETSTESFYLSGINANRYLYTNYNILPTSGNAFVLGAYTAAWNEIFVNTIASDIYHTSLSAANHIVPSTNNSKDLGSTSLNWRNGYFTTIKTTTFNTTNINVNNITVSANIVPYYQNVSELGSSITPFSTIFTQAIHGYNSIGSIKYIEIKDHLIPTDTTIYLGTPAYPWHQSYINNAIITDLYTSAMHNDVGNTLITKPQIYTDSSLMGKVFFINKYLTGNIDYNDPTTLITDLLNVSNINLSLKFVGGNHFKLACAIKYNEGITYYFVKASSLYPFYASYNSTFTSTMYLKAEGYNLNLYVGPTIPFYLTGTITYT